MLFTTCAYQWWVSPRWSNPLEGCTALQNHHRLLCSPLMEWRWVVLHFGAIWWLFMFIHGHLMMSNGVAAGAGDGTWGAWTAGEKRSGWSCLVTSAATRWTNWSNRVGGKADPVAGIAGSAAGKDGPERKPDDWRAGLLSLPLDCELWAAVRLLRGGEATRDSKAWLEGHFNRVDSQGGVW